jgi:hypothetical protein
MPYNALKFIPYFMRTGQLIQEFKGRRPGHIDRQHGYHISLIHLPSFSHCIIFVGTKCLGYVHKFEYIYIAKQSYILHVCMHTRMCVCGGGLRRTTSDGRRLLHKCEIHRATKSELTIIHFCENWMLGCLAPLQAWQQNSQERKVKL